MIVRSRSHHAVERKCVTIALRIALLAGAFFQCFSTLQAKNADLSASITNVSESSTDTAPGYADESPEIVTEGDNVHVFWFVRHPGGGHKICHRRSPDRGKTWLPTYEFYQQDLALRDPLAGPLNRHMAVINGTVHIAFGAYGGEGGGWLGKMVYLRSTDNGATFEDPRTMWASEGPWHARDVRVAAADGKLAISYRQSPNWYDNLQAHVLISSDLGATFTDTVAMTGGEGGTWRLEDFVYTGDMVAVLCMQWATTS